jgi:dTDP-4-amino-4,6-dideoxygalactose transaminase
MNTAPQAISIPLVNLKRQHESLKDELLTALSSVVDSTNFFLGPNVSNLESEFAAYCGTSWAVGLGSGTDALFLSLKAADIGPGDEVITVSHTFAATAGAITMAGATPVFIDVDPKTYTMEDPSLIEAAITPRTRAIIPVHLYGQPAPMVEIMQVAERHGLFVLEDACQAHGAELDGERAGTLGHAAAFSFYCSKNLGAYGEAGMATTNDAALAERLRMLRNHGSEVRYEHILQGTNSRLDEMQAAILRVKLPHLEEWNERRRSLADAYTRALAGINGITLPEVRPGALPVWHLYVLRTQARDALLETLKQSGIGAGIHYPIPVHLQPAFSKYGHGEGSLPHTEAVAREIISLPLFPELTFQEVSYICGVIATFSAQTQEC